jgi:hypothetical protein
MDARFVVGIVMIWGCGTSVDKPIDSTPPAKAPAKDPWATTDPAPPATDPWATTPTETPTPKPTPSHPPTPTPAASIGGSLAGTYRCQLMTYDISTGSFHYIPSTLGSFRIEPDGTYVAESFQNRSGQTRVAGTRMHFEGGPFDGWVATVGKRPDFLINGDDPKVPHESVKIGDNVCLPSK